MTRWEDHVKEQLYYSKSPLREGVQRHAERLGCLGAISDMTDINAIRFLQQKEGYTPCFGRETPWSPDPEDPKLCKISDCYWRLVCNSYRNITLTPLDKALPNARQEELELLRKRLLACNEEKNQAFSIATVGLKIRSFRNMSSATRKMLVAAPKTVFGESTEEGLTKPYMLAQASLSPGMSGMWTKHNFCDVLFTSDIDALKNWLFDTQKFSENGSLAYYPLIERIDDVAAYGKGDQATGRFVFWELPKSIKLETFNAPHIGLPDGDIMLSDAEFAPILNIDLPILEGIGFDILFKLMSDYPEELCSFRDFLRSKVEEMRQAVVGSVEFVHDCQKIEREIREQMRKTETDYKKAKLTAAFALTGCAIATWTLALYCFTQGTGSILTVLGPGGIAYTASTAYSNYLTKRLDLKDNPVYFLWLLGKSRPKT